MAIPSPWQSDIDRLLGSGDEVVRRVGERIALQFRRSTMCPPRRIVDERAAVIAAVGTWFPLPFANGFQLWVESTARLAATIETDREAALHEEQVSAAFSQSFANLMELWRRLTSFLPFIFMMTINRLGPEAMARHGGAELAAALKSYEAFYYTRSDRQAESERRILLAVLLKLFRRLDKEGVVGDAFVLAPLAERAGGFARLVPPRFEEHLLLMQEIRNRVQHDALAQRPPPILASLDRLLQAVFLDVVDILRPVCEAYQLAFVAAIRSAADGAVADAVALSGPSPLQPLVLPLPAHSADADRLAADELYLIRRGAERDAAVSPADYLNLTPFLIYERREQGRAVLPVAPEGDRRELFVFREFRENERAAVFNEFAGRAALTVSSGGTGQLRHLLDAIEMFRRDVSRLVPAAPADDRTPADEAQVLFERTWRLSRDHLACVMDPDRYAPTGQPSADAADDRKPRAYVDELFVAPAEDSVAEAFFGSPRRGLVITGPSGVGKSNLLCHWYLRARREGRPALFLAGRLLSSASFASTLLALVQQVRSGWDFARLDQALSRRDQRLLVVIDAVNEFTGPSGTQALLEDIVAFVGNESLLGRVQVVLGCREETWSQYAENRGGVRPLDPACFHSADALRLSAVDDETRRADLYAAYQRYYGLRPESYARLSPAVKALVRLPLMMALLAETYGSPEAGAEPRPIPRAVDYFSLFGQMTQRKLEDARFLAPAGEARQDYPTQVADSLYAFARAVYARLTAAAPASASSAAQPYGEAIPRDQIDRDPALAPFARPGTAGALPPLQAALQVGLLQQLFVTERSYRGIPRTGRIWKFFHDEYSQYWLSIVYESDVLQPAQQLRDAAPADFDRTSTAVCDLIERASMAPVLAGALDHWLHAGLSLPPSAGADLLVPLLDRLAARESGSVRYFVRSFLAHLLRRGIVAPDRLFAITLRAGGRDLALASAELFLEAWRDLDPSALHAAFDVGGSPHEGDVLARLGEVFARHFADAPAETAAFLDAALDPIAKLSDLRVLVLDAAALGRQVRFVFEFNQRALLAVWDDDQRRSVFIDLLLRKYRFVIDALARSRDGVRRPGLVGSLARTVVHPLLDAQAMRLWRQFVGGMPLSGNDSFFVEDHGVVQRDLVRAFVPYAVAFHNGELDPAELAPDRPLHALLLRMLNHRVTSIVGYDAAMLAPIMLRGRPDEIERLLQDLARRPTDSGRFFAGLVLAHCAYLDPDRAAQPLDILRRRMLPWFAADRFDWEWPTLFSLCITSVDADGLWPACRGILDTILGDLAARQDAAAVALADHLLKASFLGDGTLGRRVLELLLQDRRFDLEVRHEMVLKVAAGLLARNPALLRSTLEASHADPAIERQARRHLVEPVIAQRDIFSGQVNWDRAIVRSFAFNAQFRYLLLSDVVGSAARAERVEDFGPAIRRGVLNAIAMVFGGETPQGDLRLSADRVLAGSAG